MTPSVEGDQQSQKAPAYSWYALGVLFLVYLLNFVDRQILSILANDIRADLGIDDAQLGFLYGTAFAIFYALFGIPLGRLADSVPRLRLLSAGLALWSAMTILSGFARNMGGLVFARIGVGVGEATANPCAYSLISDWFPKHIRATAISIYSAGLFLGSGLSLIIGGAIVESWNAAYPGGGPLGLAGWQAAFIVVGVPGLVLAIWVLMLREPQRGEMDGLVQQGGQANVWSSFVTQVIEIVPPFTLLSAARRGRGALVGNVSAAATLAVLAFLASRAFGNGEQFWFVAIGYYAVVSWASALRSQDAGCFAMTWKSKAFMGVVALYSAVSYIGYTITYWAAPYAERTFLLSKTDLGLMVGAPNAIGGFLGVIAGGWMADRLARRFVAGRAMVAGVPLILSIPLLFVGYTTSSIATFVVCNFLANMATASALGACAAASQALVLPRMRGTAAAIFLLGPTLVGLAFGPFVAGSISETAGNLGVGVVSSLVAVIPGLMALWLVVRTYADATVRLDAGPGSN
jgi:MFS family permease